MNFDNSNVIMTDLISRANFTKLHCKKSLSLLLILSSFKQFNLMLEAFSMVDYVSVIFAAERIPQGIASHPDENVQGYV
jgi:hypothetical protein